MKKICKNCGVEKDINEFNKFKRTNSNGELKIYIKRNCKCCMNTYQKNIRLKNIDKYRKYDRDWKRKNSIKLNRTPWWLMLYNYILSKNIFNDDELVIIKFWLKKVDELGNDTI